MMVKHDLLNRKKRLLVFASACACYWWYSGYLRDCVFFACGLVDAGCLVEGSVYC
jgi:hypothetical protein